MRLLPKPSEDGKPLFYLSEQYGCSTSTVSRYRDGVGRIVEVKGKIDSDAYIQILDKILSRDEKFILLQDNTPAHASEDTYNWMSEEDINIIKDFPPYSLDLNPIEHVWGRMKKHFMISPASSKEDLWKKLNSIWLGLPLGYLKTLVESTSRRIYAAIKARGGYTKY